MLFLAIIVTYSSFLTNRKAAFLRVFYKQTNKPYLYVYQGFFFLKDLEEECCFTNYLKNWMNLTVLSS